MSASSAGWRAEDPEGGAVRAGDRPVHVFWPMLRESFRHVLLSPHRRADGDAISWTWRAPASPPAPSAADLDGLRARLQGGLADFGADMDRRGMDPASGLPGNLRPRVESMVRTLIDAGDAQLAARAVPTAGGWMIRSWGVGAPAPAVCDAQDEAASTAAETSPVAPAETPAGETAGRRTSFVRIGLVIAAALACVAAVFWWRTSEGNPTAPPAASLADGKVRAAQGEVPAAPHVEPARHVETKASEAVAGLKVAGTSAASGEGAAVAATQSSAAAANAEGAAGIAWRVSGGPQTRADDAEKPLAAPPSESGGDGARGEGVPAGGENEKPSGARTGSAASTSMTQGTDGVNDAPARRPVSSAVSASALPKLIADAAPARAATPGATPPAPAGEAAPFLFSSAQTGDAASAARRVPDVGSDDAENPRIKSAHPMEAPPTTQAAAREVRTQTRPAETAGESHARAVEMRIGEWRPVRLRDVVLPTWPERRDAGRALRDAREQARTATLRAEPSWFRQPRVTAGWDLRLASDAGGARPVWREAATGKPWGETNRNEDRVRVGWAGVLPANDVELRLADDDGHEFARLSVAARERRLRLSLSSAVIEAAPWFSLSGDEARGARWVSLTPQTWPDRAWLHGRTPDQAETICRAALPDGRRDGVLGLVERAGDWALACALTVETSVLRPSSQSTP